MIDFAHIGDTLEQTQRLPVLTPELLLEGAIAREHAARVEAAELFCQNADLVRELARLRHGAPGHTQATPASLAPAGDRHQDTEQMLFEVCGALKQTLSRVLAECQMRELPLNCAPAASRTLHEACDRLERILSGPDVALAAPAPIAAASDTRDPQTACIVSLERLRPATIA